MSTKLVNRTERKNLLIFNVFDKIIAFYRLIALRVSIMNLICKQDWLSSSLGLRINYFFDSFLLIIQMPTTLV